MSAKSTVIAEKDVKFLMEYLHTWDFNIDDVKFVLKNVIEGNFDAVMNHFWIGGVGDYHYDVFECMLRDYSSEQILEQCQQILQSSSSFDSSEVSPEESSSQTE